MLFGLRLFAHLRTRGLSLSDISKQTPVTANHQCVPDQHCVSRGGDADIWIHKNGGCMFIQVDKQLLRNQQYDDALRQACDKLSAQGIKNFIHYAESCRIVELFDPPERLKVIIDPMRGGLWLTRG